MATVQPWIGAETKALRHAMRLSIRAFAEHLGVGARTVNKWEARGSTITLLPDTQALLDTALDRAPDDVKTRFAQTMASSEQQQHTNETQPVELAHHLRAERASRGQERDLDGSADSCGL
jgi:transcriptional regulator with XRE-family HTH domain